MRIFVLLSLFFAAMTSVFCKDYSVGFPQTEVIEEPNNIINISGDMVNNRSDEGRYLMKLIDLELPEEWVVAICNPYSCLAPGTIESTFSYLPGDTGHLKISFYTSVTPDSTDFSLVFADISDGAYLADTINMRAVTRGPVNVDESPLVPPLSINPSISGNLVSIKYSAAEKPLNISVFDIRGRKTYSLDYSGNFPFSYDFSLDIQNFETGKYFVVVETVSGKIIGSFIRN